MNKTALVLLTLIASSFVLAGCSLLRGNPVPPPPPPAPEIGYTAGKNTAYLTNQFDRDTSGKISNFKGLLEAQKQVSDAQASPQVAQIAAKDLAQAQSSLKLAQANWNKIKAAPLSDPAVLAQLDHNSYMAKRWAQIALAKAGVESGLNNLAQTQQKLRKLDDQRERLAQNDARWLSQPVVPGEFGKLRFAVGTARLTRGSQTVVKRLVDFLEQHPRYGFEIDGYTDNSPPSPANLRKFVSNRPDLTAEDTAAQARAYNLDVSRHRAEALADALVTQGVARQRLKVQAFGQSKPIADNNTVAGRRKNRRVAVTVIKAPAATAKKAAKTQ